MFCVNTMMIVLVRKSFIYILNKKKKKQSDIVKVEHRKIYTYMEIKVETE